MQGCMKCERVISNDAFPWQLGNPKRSVHQFENGKDLSAASSRPLVGRLTLGGPFHLTT
jgi:hypothetical protein